MVALALPSFSILFKSFAMSKQVGVEDPDSEVHRLVTFPSLCCVSCCGQVGPENGYMWMG